MLLPCVVHAQAWSGLLYPYGSGTCTGATPTGCAVDWSVAGIPGGIPTATQAGSTITSTGSDQTSAINTALAACGGSVGAEKYVNLAAGTFVIAGTLTVPSYCYLNGQGANSTILNFTGSSGNGAIILGSSSFPSTANDTAVTSGLTAGSTSVTVASATNISVGKLLTVTELNSLGNNVNSTGTEGFCNFCDVYGGYRSSGQTVLVTGVSGTTITISPGLYWTFGSTLPSWATSHTYYPGANVTNGGNIYQETAAPTGSGGNGPYNCTSGTGSFSTTSDGTCTWTLYGSGTTTAPLATPFSPSAIQAGVENLQIYTTNAGTTTSVGVDVLGSMCENCFVHGVEVNYTDADYFDFHYSYGGEVSNNYFSNAIFHQPGTYDSTGQIDFYTSKMKIENNICERGHDCIVIERGPSGNVISYNYTLGEFDQNSPNFMIGGIDFHGANPEFNLLEGNVLTTIDLDSIWGSSTRNTEYRNWVIGSSDNGYPLAAGRNTVTSGSTLQVCSALTSGHTCNPFQGARAFQASTLSIGNNALGNVIGGPEQENNIGYGPGPGVGVTPYNSGTGQTDAVQYPVNRSYDSLVYGWSFGYSEAADDGVTAPGNAADSTLAYSSATLHGNYGNISSAIVWKTGLTHTLPASFYLSAKPSWWGTTLSYPAIGPDVTGGSGPGGHAALIPAQACYAAMGGTPGNAGSPLTFNAASCYSAGLPVAVTPTFSPVAGTYTSTQSVAITSTTPGASIYYTTDGSTPTTASSLYSTPISVSVSETIQALAVASGYTNSPVGSAAFVIGTPVAASASFSPAAGTYTSIQLVTISSSTTGATIWYNTTGTFTGCTTTTCTGATQVTGTVSVASSETLYAIVTYAGYTNSAITSAAYTINLPAAALPTLTPGAGTYVGTQSVTIASTTPGAILYYTTDGTTPTPSSTLYTGAISVTVSETVKAIAIAPGYSNSAIATAAYVINLPTASAPTFSPGTATYTSVQTVSISSGTSGATIWYNTTGTFTGCNTTTCTGATQVTGSVTVSTTQTLYAIATKIGYNNSSTSSAVYTINITSTTATPIFNPIAGVYTTTQTVIITDSTPGSIIYYTTDGTTPTTSSTVYTGGILVGTTKTINALAAASGYNNSAIAAAPYIITTTPGNCAMTLGGGAIITLGINGSITLSNCH
jgi:hypothetical protein